jgi:hypothetical protein
MEEYSAADEVLEMRKKKLLGIEIFFKTFERFENVC